MGSGVWRVSRHAVDLCEDFPIHIGSGAIFDHGVNGLLIVIRN